jgi:hypothetical protein
MFVYCFGSWLVGKKILYDPALCVFGCEFSRQAIEVMFALVQPIGVCLMLYSEDAPNQRIFSMYKCEFCQILVFIRF